MAVVTQTMQDNVTELYIGFFGRAPDAAGFGYWTNRLAVGDVTIQQISKAFAATPEFVSNYNGLTPTQQVTKVYQNVLNRAPDAGGLAYWVGQITSGAQTIADVVWNVTNSAFIQTGTADGLLVQNKVQVGEYFAITLASNDTASAATAYNLVTSNPASVAQAEATLVSATYTLTTSIDNVTGANVGITGVGTIESTGGTFTSATTFNTADTINVTGHSNLSLTVDGTFKTNVNTALNAPSVSGVEILNLRNVVAAGGTGRLTVDAANFSGLTTFNSNLSTGLTTVTNLAAGGVYQLTGNTLVTNGNLAAGYVATATAATLNVVGGTKGTGGVALSGTGLTSATINSTGAANAVGAVALNSSSSVTTLNVNASTDLTTGNITGFKTSGTVTATIAGAGAVNIGSLQSDAATLSVNASTNTGGVTVALGNAGQKFTGGSGNDVLYVENLAITKAQDGGTGSADVVAFSASTNYTAAAAQISNFEILRVDDAGTSGGQGTYDLRLISGLTGAQIGKLAGATALTGLSAAQAANVRIIETTAGTTTLGVALADASGTSDVLSIELKSTAKTPTAVDALTGLTSTFNGFETINVASNGGLAAGTANSLAISNATSAKTINITGNSDFTGSISAASATVISAAAMANAVDLTIAAAPTTVVAVTGGSANDTLRIAAGNLSNAVTLNGGTGTDTLAITGTAGAASTLTDAQFTNISNVEKVGVTVALASSAAAFNFTASGFFQGAFVSTGGNAQFDATIEGTTANSSVDFSAINTNMTSTLSTGILSDTKNVSLLGGSGNDTLTVVATEASSGTTGSLVSISGGAGVDTIKATVTTSTGVISTSFTGGAGADVMYGTADVVDSFAYVAKTDSTTTAYDTVFSFVGGSNDTLNFAASTLGLAYAVAADATGTFGTIATGMYSFTNGPSSLTDAIAKVSADVKTAGNAVIFEYAGDTYFFADQDGAATSANDALIRLVGLDSASMSASSEVFTIAV